MPHKQDWVSRVNCENYRTSWGFKSNEDITEGNNNAARLHFKTNLLLRKESNTYIYCQDYD